jgi:hypothetical protein
MELDLSFIEADDLDQVTSEVARLAARGTDFVVHSA